MYNGYTCRYTVDTLRRHLEVLSYTTNIVTSSYVAVVNGTYVGATGEIRDAHHLFQQEEFQSHQ